MALRAPRYIRASGIDDIVIRYLWDDWDTNADERDLAEDFCARLKGLSQRANLGFTIATAEWIVHRYERLADTLTAWQYLEAAWAQVIDRRYGRATIEGDVDENLWSGPILRPIWSALLQVEFTIGETHDDGFPEVGAARLITLAEHVIINPAPYQVWRKQVVPMLERIYHIDEEERLGDVVPREALDPDVEFRPEDTEALVNAFLARLDPSTNPFLNSAENMTKEGFEGTPYRFSAGADRRARVEW